MATVYLSYRVEDSGILAESLGMRLSQLGGHRMYPYALPFGSDVPAARRSMLQGADVLIIAIGPRWLLIKDFYGQRRIDDQEDPVHQEIVMALWLRKPIIPVLLGGGRMPTTADLPQPLQAIAGLQPFQTQPSPDSSREALGLNMKISKVASMKN
jgi:hypothetical protein